MTDKPLRILHTVEYYAPHVGGAERVVQELSERLARRGHEVTVATSTSPDRHGLEMNGVRVIGFDVRGNAADGISGADVRRYGEFLGGRGVDVMMNYAAQQWATDLAFPTIRPSRSHRANVIAPCGYSALDGPGRLRWPAFRSYFERDLPAVLPWYDAAIYHSERYQDRAFAERIGVYNATVIPNGVGEDEFLAAPAIDFRDVYGITTPHLGLCVANFLQGKRHDRLIEAVRQMARADFTLALVGASTPWLPTLRELAQGLPILFLPDLPRTHTVAAYQAADVFLFASEIEASPLVILEAKASRTPFVATDAGNIREWAGGIVCAPEALAAETSRLLDDSERRARLADEGWREWREHLTWTSVVDRYEALYLRLRAVARTRGVQSDGPARARTPRLEAPRASSTPLPHPQRVRVPVAAQAAGLMRHARDAVSVRLRRLFGPRG